MIGLGYSQVMIVETKLQFTKVFENLDLIIKKKTGINWYKD